MAGVDLRSLEWDENEFVNLLDRQLKDFHSVDSVEWDDTELIRAYNKGLKPKQGDLVWPCINHNRHSSQPEESKERKWNVGDYCRAKFTGDQTFYEAKIINLNGDYCTVEYVGYGDTDDIDLLELEKSEGRKARKKQFKASISDSIDKDSSISESEPGEDTTDETVEGCSSSRKKKRNVNKPANNATIDTTVCEATIHQRYAASSPSPAPSPAPSPSFIILPPRMPTNRPIMEPPATMPQYQVPPAPPMPQIPSRVNDPSISSMMSAWYMAGYYTGLNSAQKENRECQRCCGHSNNCSRN